MLKKIKADIHSPEELLEGARSYLHTNDPQMMRAVVLEAFTALETFVHERVFSLLENKLDPLLMKWLRHKSRIGLDDRLHVLSAVALSKEPIDRTSRLWRDYLEAKRIRNNVTHRGIRVNRMQAQKVVDTVYEWLAYLGSTVEVELNLLRLKKHLEENKSEFVSPSEVERNIIEYFERDEYVTLKPQVRLSRGRFSDMALRFGKIRVIVEVKIVPDESRLRYMKMDYLEQAKWMLEDSGFDRAAIVVVFTRKMMEIYKDKVLTFNDGKISIVGADMTQGNLWKVYS